MSVRRIFLRRSSASEWASENPILSLGEPGFDYTNEILKIGNGVDQWSALAQFQGPTGATGPAGQDGQDGADGQDGVDGVSINTYTTANLPHNASLGTVAFDTTLSVPVYFKYGKWYKVSDDTEVADRIVEIYIIAGQSNAGGNGGQYAGGASSTLASYTQLDGVGTLAETRSHILFSNNYHDTSTDPTTTLNNVTPGALTVGNTTKSSGLHGLEISFLDGLDHVRTAKQMAMKYYVDGAEIGKFSKANSNATNSSNANNAWDGLTASIDSVNAWASTNGYTLEWKGLVWWQGESHLNRTTAQHQSLLQTLITDIRTYVSKSTLPVCLIQVDSRTGGTDASGTGASSESGILPIQQAHINTATADNDVEVIDTSTYVGDMYYQDDGNGSFNAVHWTTQGHVPIGYDTATRMNNIIQGTLSWSPTGMTAISAWYDVTDSATLTSSNNLVSQWENKKATRHLTQSIASRQPTLLSNQFTGLDNISRDGLSFDGSNLTGLNGVFDALGTNLTEASLFMVVKYPQFPFSPNNAILWGQAIGNGANYANGYAHFPVGTTDQTVVRFSTAGNQWSNNIVSQVFTGWLTQNNVYILEFTFSDTDNKYKMRINSAIKSNANLGTGWVSGNNFKSGDTTIGAWNNSSANPTKVIIGEVFALNAYLNTSDREKIEGYLAYRYGALLPTTHTYYNTHP